MFIFERERGRERAYKPGRSRERHGDIESEAGSRLQAVSAEPHTGLEHPSYEIMTGAEVRRLTDGATQVPQACFRLCDFLPLSAPPQLLLSLSLSL